MIKGIEKLTDDGELNEDTIDEIRKVLEKASKKATDLAVNGIDP